MAATSHTSPSTSTSTPASGSSTATTDPDGGGDSTSDLFSPSGSPPLIVAFFAVGSFIVVMIGLFGWRRLSRSRGLDIQPVTRLDRRDKTVSLGERPMLWDVWSDLYVRERWLTGGMAWQHLAPMAASLTRLVPPVTVEPLPPTNPVDPGGRIPFRTGRSWVLAVGRFCLPESPPLLPPLLSQVPASDKDEVVPPAHTSDEIEWGDASSVQVSVIITMPGQRWCRGGTEADMGPKALGEFCMGTMDVPWSDGERRPGMNATRSAL